MENNKRPTMANGKICYIEIPAADINQSAAFYQAVFGWNIRRDGDDFVSFDDSVGEVSGMWVTGRKPATEQGLLVSLMVEDMATTLQAIVANGGSIVQPNTSEGPGAIALFSDVAGNIFCLYQSGSL